MGNREMEVGATGENKLDSKEILLDDLEKYE